MAAPMRAYVITCALFTYNPTELPRRGTPWSLSNVRHCSADDAMNHTVNVGKWKYDAIIKQ
ncbi:hypothetical protein AKJ16_DCAP21240 [Drosera capensis]